MVSLLWYNSAIGEADDDTQASKSHSSRYGTNCSWQNVSFFTREDMRKTIERKSEGGCNPSKTDEGNEGNILSVFISWGWRQDKTASVNNSRASPERGAERKEKRMKQNRGRDCDCGESSEKNSSADFIARMECECRMQTKDSSAKCSDGEISSDLIVERLFREILQSIVSLRGKKKFFQRTFLLLSIFRYIFSGFYICNLNLDFNFE